MKPQDTGSELAAPTRPYFPASLSSLLFLVQAVCLLLQLDLQWPSLLDTLKPGAKYAGKCCVEMCILCVFVLRTRFTCACSCIASFVGLLQCG